MTENTNSNTPFEGKATQNDNSSCKTLEKRFWKHLLEYPIVNYTKEIAYKIPYVKQVRISVAPSLKYIGDTQPIKLAADKTDILGDYALNQVDKLVPTLKTFEVQDVTMPISRSVNGMIQGAQNSINEVNTTLHKTIVDPSNKVASDLKNHISACLVDKNGKTLVISHADPIILPLNDSLERLINSYFPMTEKVSKEGYPSEAARTFKIVYNTVSRKQDTEPKVDLNVSEVPTTA